MSAPRRRAVNIILIVCMLVVIVLTAKVPLPWSVWSLDQMVDAANAGQVDQINSLDFYITEINLIDGRTFFAYLDPSYHPMDLLVVNGVEQANLDRIEWHDGPNWNEVIVTVIGLLPFVAAFYLINRRHQKSGYIP